MDQKKTIMVVDDMSQIRNILQFNLRKEGYNVVLASNGKKALEYASGEKTPDLIILDIMMPKMDGYEVIRKLRASDITKHVPVIFLSAKAQKKDVIKGLEAGANDYIVKPFKFVDLHKKIEGLLGLPSEHLNYEMFDKKYLKKVEPWVLGKQAKVPSGKTQKTIKTPKRSTPDRALAAIMITDMVDFSKEMEADEEHTYSKLITHNEIIRKSISKNHGEEIKTIGDAFLVRFKSALDSVKASVNIQQEFSEYNKDKKKVDQILVRIGIHIGDILTVDNDVFGNEVNIASRIQTFAEPGSVYISADVYNFVKKSADIKMVSIGKKELKNIKDSPEIFKVLIQ
jgi:CheY-like chemotaxis protein/class 3 adenylate cyclase